MESESVARPTFSLPLARVQHGFGRTTCGCQFCQAPCRHLPGSLDVADLTRLCPPDQDLFTWAALHLRAITDKPFPTLVPVRQTNGHCHWLFDGRCAVHENAPYSCAFFDAHMSETEVEQRSAATIAARQMDAEHEGLYYRVWDHLRRKGLVARSGDRQALAEEMAKIRGRAEGTRRRS